MDVEPYPDEMFEEAARREETFQHLAAAERQELAHKSLDELTRDEKIQLALEEIDWVVIGGQDGEEYYNSIQFIRKVLRSLK